MAMAEMNILSHDGWYLYYFMVFPFDYIQLTIMTVEKRKMYQVIRATDKHLSTKIQELISNIVIWEKWKTLSDIRIPGTQIIFSRKVSPDIDGSTDEPVVQCDIQVVENTFADYC